MTDEQRGNDVTHEKTVERFEEEATAAKRSHNEPEEWVISTEGTPEQQEKQT